MGRTSVSQTSGQSRTHRATPGIAHADGAKLGYRVTTAEVDNSAAAPSKSV